MSLHSGCIENYSTGPLWTPTPNPSHIYIYIMGLVGLHTYYVFAHFLGGAGWLEYFTLLYSTLLLA
jgi:hypothetical protein